MDITINTPALLFSAISLIMLAYTSRFLSVTTLVRTLIKEHQANGFDQHLDEQIKYLKIRLHLIKNMQVLGVAGFLFALVSMYLIYMGQIKYAEIFFSISVITFLLSLILSLIEIYRSTAALEVALSLFELNKSDQKFNDIPEN